MIKGMLARYRQGHRTIRFPDEPPVMPARFRGRPALRNGLCPAGCGKCAEGCPTGAIKTEAGTVRVDLGRCLFCGKCAESCSPGAIVHTAEYRMATSRREDLETDGRAYRVAGKLEAASLKVFGRSLQLRSVSAGGCNGCEVETAVLNTVVFDLGRFGIQFVASPRHADGVLVTGPVTRNMSSALVRTYKAIPPPKIVILVGACAISGGLYRGHPETRDGAEFMGPAVLYVPGCPPHPVTILDGLLRLIGRIKP
jgi:Ni,Fe-hydrogenase III small subunit/formate hydrogenlyase subunit 6/NADH:ubiquinone oxidoreductase subunit I